MSPSASLALLRIELKLDLLLEYAQRQDPALAALLAEGNALLAYDGDVCPACKSTVTVRSDLNSEEYVRSCACRPPVKIVPGISKLTIPIVEKKPPTPPVDMPAEPEEPANAQDPDPRGR